MDILDIDEALKDDSYIFLADKTHDDISNILQQWKTNNHDQSHLQQQSQQRHLQNSNDQAYQLNSKTFTRPKRRLQAAANLDKHFSQTQSPTTNSGTVMLEIGGLVTNMHKSFLQDTSPPSSICISMNNGCMNNSLITSADFTNLNFLQSINSLEKSTNSPEQNRTTVISEEAYTFSDFTRDRKVIESLCISGDGTLIKDSHIGQIDDISLMTMSKTASCCSTMDNSTDSVSTTNDLCLPANSHSQRRLSTTMVLTDEMIGDTTFSLVDSLTARTTVEALSEGDTTSTFKRPTVLHSAVLNETLLLAGRQINNTYTEGFHTPEAERCDTPENVEMKLASIQMQSTPLTSGNPRFQHNNNKPLNYTPTIKGRTENINISPIVSSTTTHKNDNTRQQLNHTFEPPNTILTCLQSEQGNGCFKDNKTALNTFELLELNEHPALDATYNKTEEHMKVQCEAEVELLAQQDDEEQFENMLANLGLVNKLNAEQLKMQKSLDSIKRRFQKDDDHDSHVEQNEQQQALNVHLVTPPSTQSHLKSSHSNSFGQSTSGGERLLNRRSRLYDGVNLSAMHDSDSNGIGCNSTSFIVHPREEDPANIFKACSPQQETDVRDTKGTEVNKLQEGESSSSKLTGRRNRDRERFKTIKITKEMRLRDSELEDIVLPCIDDEEHQHQQFDTVQLQHPQQSPCRQLSRHDQISSNNLNQVQDNEIGETNFLTYKKSKEKMSLIHKAQQLSELTSAESGQSSRPQPRSLSRPRYISGLQKLATVSKAISAGTGLNTTASANLQATTMEDSPETSNFGVLKSPMGIKSKSFHNLSSNINSLLGANGVAAITPRASLGGALRRPSVQVSKPSTVLRGTQQHEQDEACIFKVPKLVSGLRAPTAAGVKRAIGNGLARPSSGYYSLNVKPTGESETPESLSSASSRGSLYGKETNACDSYDTQTISLKLTQVTTGTTGIPKPSGLRQPKQIQRSGLPRPSSILRR